MRTRRLLSVIVRDELGPSEQLDVTRSHVSARVELWVAGVSMYSDGRSIPNHARLYAALSIVPAALVGSLPAASSSCVTFS